jgi:hypothetical protein
LFKGLAYTRGSEHFSFTPVIITTAQCRVYAASTPAQGEAEIKVRSTISCAPTLAIRTIKAV